jgi:hypothetical protein
LTGRLCRRRTAVAFEKDGTIWVTRNALTPGGAEVISLG